MLQKHIYIIFFLSSFLSYSQNSIKTDTLNLLSFAQEDGITQLNINGITQDANGYLCFGTQDGLYHFNGTDFKKKLHNPLDSLSIPDDFIVDVFSSNKGLYVSTKTKGLYRYNKKQNRFRQILKQHTFRIHKLDKQTLLFSVKNKIVIYNELNDTKQTLLLDSVKNDVFVKGVINLGDNQYLLATNFNGILLFNKKNATISSFLRVDNTDHRAVLKVGDDLYVGTENGLYKYSFISKKISPIIKQQTINHILLKSKEVLWLGSENGLLEYTINKNRAKKWVFKDPSGKLISKVVINNIFDDGAGNYFFGTVGEGLWYFNDLRNKFATIKLKIPAYSKSKKISSFQFLPYKDSTLFIGCSHNVLKYNFNTKAFKHYDSFSKAIIWSITKDFRKEIWIGGYKIGLRRYNEVLDDFESEQEIAKFFSNKGIINITPLSEYELLISTYRSNSYKYNYKTKKIEDFLIGDLPLSKSRVSFYDSKNNLWLGTDQNELYRLAKNGGVTHFSVTEKKNKKISHNRINGITEDKKGNIWIATSSGLNRYHSEKDEIYTFYSQEGFPNDYVYTVQVDANNSIWVSTNWGISVLNTETDTFKNYTQEDGLQNNEFNTKASYKDSYNNLYFGGVDGINIFHPDAIKKTKPLWTLSP